MEDFTHQIHPTGVPGTYYSGLEKHMAAAALRDSRREGLGPSGFITLKDSERSQRRWRRELRENDPDVTDVPPMGSDGETVLEWFRNRLAADAVDPEKIREHAIRVARAQFVRVKVKEEDSNFAPALQRRSRGKFPPDDELLKWYDETYSKNKPPTGCIYKTAVKKDLPPPAIFADWKKQGGVPKVLEEGVDGFKLYKIERIIKNRLMNGARREGMGPNDMMSNKEVIRARARWRQELKTDPSAPPKGCTDLECCVWFRQKQEEDHQNPEKLRNYAVELARYMFVREANRTAKMPRRRRPEYPPDDQLLTWYDEIIMNMRRPPPVRRDKRPKRVNIHEGEAEDRDMSNLEKQILLNRTKLAMREGNGPTGQISLREYEKAAARMRRERSQGETDVPADECSKIEAVEWYRRRSREDAEDPATIMSLAVKFARSVWVREQRRTNESFQYSRNPGAIDFPKHEDLLKWYDDYRAQNPPKKRPARHRDGKSPIHFPKIEILKSRKISDFEKHLQNKMRALADRLEDPKGRENTRALRIAAVRWKKEHETDEVPSKQELRLFYAEMLRSDADDAITVFYSAVRLARAMYVRVLQAEDDSVTPHNRPPFPDHDELLKWYSEHFEISEEGTRVKKPQKPPRQPINIPEPDELSKRELSKLEIAIINRIKHQLAAPLILEDTGTVRVKELDRAQARVRQMFAHHNGEDFIPDEDSDPIELVREIL